jgi:hypothetical protein
LSCTRSWSTNRTEPTRLFWSNRQMQVEMSILNEVLVRRCLTSLQNPSSTGSHLRSCRR